MSRRVAVYARFSSDAQNPRSIDDQVALCRGFAEARGWSIVATYSDAAISGAAAENRPGYQRLLEDALAAGARRFDVVLVEDLSRLTRSTEESLRLERLLSARQVEIVGIADGISTARAGGTAGKIHLTVKGLANELYLADLRAKTHRGLAATFRRGESTGGATFGYRSVRVGADGAARLEVDPDQAAVVRRIFRDYASGLSLKAIAHALNDERVPFPAQGTGKETLRRGWGPSTIRWMLRNERYLGRVTWNRLCFEKDPVTGRRRPVPRPASEWARLEQPELRIIDDELAADVAERVAILKERYGAASAGLSAARAAASRHLLSGLLRCGLCSGRMVADRTIRRKRGKVYEAVAYRCGLNRSKGPAVCPHADRYPKAAIESVITDWIRAAVEEPGLLEELTAMVQATVDRACAPNDDRQAAIAAELRDVRARAGHLVAFLAGGGDSSLVRAELAAAEARAAELEREAAVLAARPGRAPRMHPASLRRRLRDVLALLEGDPVRAKAELARQLEGDLRLTPLVTPASAERMAMLQGSVRPEGLLAFGQEARSRERMIAGGRATPNGDALEALPFTFMIPRPHRRGVGS